MKLKSQSRSVIQSSTSFESTEFAIKASDSPVIMEMLRSKIYSNKVAAVVREYITNALDEHKNLNVTSAVPIVTAPTHESPEFKVRDFGKGLTPNEIKEIYINYGCSTKRNSDELTGGLGIGCKAGFAYGSQFTITSWTLNPETMNIDKNVYAAVIDESNVGTLKHIGHTELPFIPGEPSVDMPSYNSTGIEIGIAVAVEDVKKFHTELWNLRMTSAQPFDIQGTISEQFEEPVKYLIEKEHYRKVDPTQAYQNYNKYNSAVVIMGNIGYPVNSNMLSCTAIGRELANNSNYHLFFNVGDLSIASNREELEYNKDTIQLLSSKLNSIGNEIVEELKNVVLKNKCLISRKVAYYDHVYSASYGIKNAIHNLLPRELINYYIQPDNKDFINYHYKEIGGTDKLYGETNHRGTINTSKREISNEYFVFYDVPLAKGQITRSVKTLIKEHPDLSTASNLYVWQKLKSDSIQAAFNKLGIPHVDKKRFINLMNYEPMKPAKAVRNGNNNASVQLFSFNRSAYGATDTWKDAGNVTISDTNRVFFVHLSGHYAIDPQGVNDTNKLKHQLDKEKIKLCINIITRYSQHLPKDIIKILQNDYPDPDKVNNFNIVNNHEFVIYGVRKNNYKLFNDDNSYNLIEITRQCIQSEVDRLALESNSLGNYIKMQDQWSEQHGEFYEQKLSWRGSRGYTNHTEHYNRLLQDYCFKPYANLFKKLKDKSLYKLQKMLNHVHTSMFSDIVRWAVRFNVSLDKVKSDFTDTDLVDTLAYVSKKYALLPYLLARQDLDSSMFPGNVYQIVNDLTTVDNYDPYQKDKKLMRVYAQDNKAFLKQVTDYLKSLD